MHITFLCLGNICRSPMAEYIAKHLLKTKYINQNISITSAGTSGYHNGDDMHMMTKQILNKHQINCNGFVSKKINQHIYDTSDYVVVMDSSNIENLKRIVNVNDDKIIKITDYLITLKYNDVPDPWYTLDFDETYNILIESIDNFLNWLIINKIQ